MIRALIGRIGAARHVYAAVRLYTLERLAVDPHKEMLGFLQLAISIYNRSFSYGPARNPRPSPPPARLSIETKRYSRRGDWKRWISKQGA